MTSCRETERKNVAASPAAVAQKLGDVYQEHLRFETVENQISQEDDPDNGDYFFFVLAAKCL